MTDPHHPTGPDPSSGLDAATAQRVLDCTGYDAATLAGLEHFPDPAHPDEVVFLSGSYVTGHANPWSDIDVFVVGERGTTTDRALVASTNEVVAHFLDGKRVDYEFWAPAAVADIARRLADHRLAAGQSIQGASLLQIEQILIHRIRIGVPLCNPDGFAALQAQFDFDHFAGFLAEEAIRHLDAEVEDLIGMRKGGDRETALWVARQVVDVNVEAYLHSLGHTDPVAKWRVRYLRALPPSPRHDQLRADYDRLMFPDLAWLREGDNWHGYVEEVLEFSNRVSAWTQG